MNPLKIDKPLEGILKGKIVVVTGAGSGLGKAIALGIPFTGVKIGLIDLNKEAISETKKEIDSIYGKGTAFEMPANVTDETQLDKAYSELENTLGSADILINCAGLARLGPVNTLTQKDVSLANDVNLDGYFLNTVRASKKMIERKEGTIINISSASARGASESSSLYGVAKEAQCMMTREWAMDLGKHGIRVNSILCGDLFGNEDLGIASGIWNRGYFEKKAVSKGLVKEDDSRLSGDKLNPEIRKLVIDYYTGRTALGREVTYKDVVTLIIILSSDLCSNISGESISLTSGNPSAFSR